MTRFSPGMAVKAERASSPLENKFFAGAYLASVVLLLILANSDSFQNALRAGIPGMDLAVFLVGSGADETSFFSAAVVFLFVLLILSVIHCLWIVATARRVYSHAEVAAMYPGLAPDPNRSTAKVRYGFPMFWLLLQCVVFLIPGNSLFLGNLRASSPLAFGLYSIVFVFAGNVFLTIAVIAWRDKLSKEKDQVT